MSGQVRRLGGRCPEGVVWEDLLFGYCCRREDYEGGEIANRQRSAKKHEPAKSVGSEMLGFRDRTRYEKRKGKYDVPYPVGKQVDDRGLLESQRVL